MTIARNVADVLASHVTLEVECIDRMYLNLYVPGLQYESGVVGFLRGHRGFSFASSALMAPMTRAFVADVERFVAREDLDLVSFDKGQRKDDLARAYLAGFDRDEGVLFVGKAQEKTRTFRTEKRRNLETGASYPWIVRATAIVNQFYFYCVDRDFGPFFVKFSSYFPHNAKLCINGNEWAKRQARRAGIAFEPLDNGFASCEQPQALQRVCEGLDSTQIDALARKWFAILPHPFTASDRKAGYRYDISILQAEFSLTQVLDRPLTGRVFFEDVIRDNLDLGRPDHVSLIFNKRVDRRTPGLFRTRVITEGVTPSLHIDYKHTRIKQYHKEGRALRTETTINDTYDFKLPRRLPHLRALREIGFTANRRLQEVQRTSADCHIGQDAFNRVCAPVRQHNQRAPALRFGEPHAQALLSTLVIFRLLPEGFTNRDLRAHLAPLLGHHPSAITPGRMTYDLRRLRLHGLIERIPRTHRYRVTPFGLRVAMFFTRTYNRLLRPGLSHICAPAATDTPLRRHFDQLEATITTYIHQHGLAA